MLRGRPALVHVFLCFVCLLRAKPLPHCTQDIIKRVNILMMDAPTLKWLECRLYTPSIEDYRKCPSFTFKCFADEFKVLINEWRAVTSYNKGHKLLLRLQHLPSLFNKTESNCRECELLKEQDAEQFLKDLHSTLQLMNVDYC